MLKASAKREVRSSHSSIFGPNPFLNCEDLKEVSTIMYSKSVNNTYGKTRKDPQNSKSPRKVVGESSRSSKVSALPRPQTPLKRTGIFTRSRSSPSLTTEVGVSCKKESSKLKQTGLKFSVVFPKSDKNTTPHFCTPRRNLGNNSTPKREASQSSLKRSQSETRLNVLVTRSNSEVDGSHNNVRVDEETSNLTVAIRVRPLSFAEQEDPTVSRVVTMNNSTIEVRDFDTIHSFTYDHCLWSCDENHTSYVSQEVIFTTLAQPLLDRVFEGYNACLFAYGQTGSGKSYSMMGPDSCTSDSNFNKDAGIIPRFCYELFQHISSFQEAGRNKPKVEVSYFQIYNEKIHDLLRTAEDGSSGVGPALKVREHPTFGPYVVDLSVNEVKSFKEMQRWLDVGKLQRVTAATKMNEYSSRSHSIFTITLTQTEVEGMTGDHRNWQSKVNLVDLAGSERLANTSASGDRLKEGVSINRSLLTLGKVITALAENGSSKKIKFVPYRESVLTWLLKESLGGNSRTTMLATISPASSHVEETLATLRYACQARSIVNRVRVNEAPHEQLIRALSKEVAELRAYREDHQSSKVGVARRLINGEAPEPNSNDIEIKILKERLKQSEENFKQTTTILNNELAELQAFRNEHLKETATVACTTVDLENTDIRDTEIKNLKELLKQAEENLFLINTSFNKELEELRAFKEKHLKKVATVACSTIDLEESDGRDTEIKKLKEQLKQSEENLLLTNISLSKELAELRAFKEEHLSKVGVNCKLMNVEQLDNKDFEIKMLKEKLKQSEENLKYTNISLSKELSELRAFKQEYTNRATQILTNTEESASKNIEIHKLKEELKQSEKDLLHMNKMWEEKLAAAMATKEHEQYVKTDGDTIYVNAGIQPCLMNLSADKMSTKGYALLHILSQNVTHVSGSKENSPFSIFLPGLNVRKDICQIKNENNILTLIPSANSDICVNGQAVTKSTLLQHGDCITFVKTYTFQVITPQCRTSSLPTKRSILPFDELEESHKQIRELEQKLTSHEREVKHLKFVIEKQKTKLETAEKDKKEQIKEKLSLEKTLRKYKRLEVLSQYDLSKVYQPYKSHFLNKLRKLCNASENITSGPPTSKTVNAAECAKIAESSYKKDSDSPSQNGVTVNRKTASRIDNSELSLPPSSKRFKSMSSVDATTPTVVTHEIQNIFRTTDNNNVSAASNNTTPCGMEIAVAQSHSSDDIRLFVKEANQRCKVLGINLEFELEFRPGTSVCKFVKVENRQANRCSRWKISHFLDWLIKLRHHRLDKPIDDLESSSMWEADIDEENQQNLINCQNVTSLVSRFSSVANKGQEKNVLYDKGYGHEMKSWKSMPDLFHASQQESKDNDANDKYISYEANINDDDDNNKEQDSCKGHKQVSKIDLHNSFSGTTKLFNKPSETDDSVDNFSVRKLHLIQRRIDEEYDENFSDDEYSDNPPSSESLEDQLNKSMVCSSPESSISSNDQQSENESSSQNSTFSVTNEEEITKHVQLIEDSYVRLKQLCQNGADKKDMLDLLEKPMERLRDLLPVDGDSMNSPLRKYSPPHDLSITPAKSNLKSPANVAYRTPKSVTFNLPYSIEESPSSAEMSPAS